MNYEYELTHFKDQLALLQEAIHAISVKEIGYQERTSVIGPILQLTYQSGRSINLLAENKAFREVLILSRPFIEGIINVAFICAKGEEAIINAKNHALQRGYRDLYREYDNGGLKISIGLVVDKDLVDQARPQSLLEALSKFTNKKGDEIPSWTKETTKQKIEAIGVKYGEKIQGFLDIAFFVTYRDLSEIIHNSYCGALLYMGMNNPESQRLKSMDDAIRYMDDHQERLTLLTFQQLSLTIHSSVQILMKTYPNSNLLDNIAARSLNILNKYADENPAKP